MAKGVFMHRHDSIYDDIPSQHYQFPKQYLSRAKQFINDWIIYLEPSNVPMTRGYFAVAKVSDIIADPNSTDRFLAIIEDGTYLDFGGYVQYRQGGQYIERGLLNREGKLSGRAQSAVRPISDEDFNRIISLGLGEEILPRQNDHSSHDLHEETQPIEHYPQPERIRQLTERTVRDRNFRKVVLTAYNETCAITGLRLINGGGRAEAEAAHIKPVEHNGPDIVSNGIALSGTAHWMFDRGLISLSNDFEILISRQTNDPNSIKSLINSSGILIKPERRSDFPKKEFIEWHRLHCFKG